MVLGAAVGAVLLFIGDFNPDDYNFFHRALAQLDYLDESFFRHETGLTPSGLPQLSLLHVMTSYEPLVALAAYGVRIAPLFAYQNVAAFIGAFLMVVGWAVLYRTMGMGRRPALRATIAALAFMVLDLRPGRNYGSILPYIWTGKALLWGILLPWTITFTVRYLRRPLLGRLAVVALTGICAVGLSGSGIFLFPVQVFCVSLAYLSLRSPNRQRLWRVAKANAASVYCVAIAVLAVSAILPRPTDISVWTNGWPQWWWSNLGMVFDGPAVLIRDGLAIFLLPLVALKRPWGRFVAAFGAAFVLVVANPLAGPVWMDLVTPGAYWRFAFLLPIAWSAGLVVVAVGRRAETDQFRATTIGIAVLYLTTVLFASRHTFMDTGSNLRALHLKAPSASRLPLPEAEFARLVSPSLVNRKVVCPERACIALALTDPGIRFEAVRGTPHVLANAGKPAEGIRRQAAQLVVTYGATESADALSGSLDQGADALIIANSERVRSLVLPLVRERDTETWTIEAENPEYMLLLRQ